MGRATLVVGAKQDLAISGSQRPALVEVLAADEQLDAQSPFHRPPAEAALRIGVGSVTVARTYRLSAS